MIQHHQAQPHTDNMHTDVLTPLINAAGLWAIHDMHTSSVSVKFKRIESAKDHAPKQEKSRSWAR